MRQTLRRSCAACAKSKHSCDLRTPRCSRCLKRRVQCIYANEPLTTPDPDPSEEGGRLVSPKHVHESGSLTKYQFGSLDPFDSYPSTRLARDHVQRLIHSFIHKIAFQYYPLDLNASTNPFLISWWPLALGDPALFHVSLQTACLDEELLAQKGFRASELLMVDSVGLLRRKVGEMELATQDGTMDSVITLAAIEFGKGNTSIANMHVEGVKSLVNIRGGISAVRQTSPLTSRMVSWVSMLVKGHPQFQTQDDMGTGEGIPPIPEWQLDSTKPDEEKDEDETNRFFPDIIAQLGNDEVQNVFIRLKHSFRRARRYPPFPSTRLHDLTCFVVHRLLLTAPSRSLQSSAASPVTECVRYAIILYMFTIQGPTYFSHAVILDSLLGRFMGYLEQLDSMPRKESGSRALDIWLLSIGLVASSGTSQIRHRWFGEKVRVLAGSLGIGGWVDVRECVMGMLWLEIGLMEDIFRGCWDGVLGSSELGLTIGMGYDYRMIE